MSGNEKGKIVCATVAPTMEDLMGGVNKKEIAKAGKFLFKFLGENKGTVDYSFFYDGTGETSDRLKTWVLDNEPEYTSVELLMDLAAQQLEDQGLTKLTWLESKLDDGEPDYRIEFTELGKSTDSLNLKFRDVNL